MYRETIATAEFGIITSSNEKGIAITLTSGPGVRYNPLFHTLVKDVTIFYHADKNMWEIVGEEVQNELIRYNRETKHPERYLDDYVEKHTVNKYRNLFNPFKPTWSIVCDKYYLKEGWVTLKETKSFRLLTTNITIVDDR